MSIFRSINFFPRRVATGYSRSAALASFNHDGLELARVRRKSRYLPVWHIIFFIYLAMVIRLVVAADIGTAGYEARVHQMKNGSTIERMAAVVMEMDPVSRELAMKVRAGLAFLNERVLNREV